MEKYVNTEYHFVRNSGGLSGKELAKLSDDELAEYLRQDSILQEKKKYRINPDFILREIAGEYTIIPIGGDNVFSNAVMAPNGNRCFSLGSISAAEHDTGCRSRSNAKVRWNGRTNL